MGYSATHIADYILSAVDLNSGDTISPLKLQKLLYYCQAWHVTIFGTPLIDEDFRAWAHGPVVESQFHRFKDTRLYDAIDIAKIEFGETELDEQAVDIIQDVLGIYGEHSASYLENLTHSERPWREARGNLGPHEKSNALISLDSMRQYYSTLLPRD